METTALLSDLISRTQAIIIEIESLKEEPLELLKHKASEQDWSALECIEHLNRYGNFYNAKITENIKQNLSEPTANFNPGWLGNFFAESMLPKENSKKMKTFASKNPNGSVLTKETLTTFVKQQYELLNLLEIAKNVNLNTIKIPTTLSSLLKLKLGDTFRFVIFHNQRHLLQAKKAIQKSKG
ncbi:DinB family protein [Flavobacterium luminosum]|uniref:DinB family protein n=1 Tax=Flavobacterium luminosum TaxID=2949086 RepID=A0ABT0TNA6_9FLAO|nr:DinB family protein [Flavobacterium sp. HXWNR70]MCL9808830.1 DinB family protein [Flavobacterium sp. HXWNR70]